MCNFHYNCVSDPRKVSSANGPVRDDEFGFGSCSNRPRTVNVASTVLGKFLLVDFGVQFCVAVAVFAEVEG